MAGTCRVVALSGCAVLLAASCGGTNGANERATTAAAPNKTSALTPCPRTHAVGIDDLAVQGVSCAEARVLANTALHAQPAGFICAKTSEGVGYTAWRCVSPTATFTYRFYADE